MIQGITALLCACYNGNVDIFKYLVQHGADINSNGFVCNYKTYISKYIIIYILTGNIMLQYPLLLAEEPGRAIKVKELLSFGIDINIQDKVSLDK